MIKNFLDSDSGDESESRQNEPRANASGQFSSILSINDDGAAVGEANPETDSATLPVPDPPEFLPHTETESIPTTEKPSRKRTDYTPPTADESVRMSGLAWSAGIMLFGSIVFMLILGWFADLLFGSTPYGIVIGMVLGAIIGFVQIFRINAEIIRTPKTQSSMNILNQPKEIAEAPKTSNDGLPPPESGEMETRSE